MYPFLPEELGEDSLVQNLPGFARFLPVAGLFHGQVLNTSRAPSSGGPVRSPPRNAVPCSKDGSRPRSRLTPTSIA
jgi:hypothetical protein